MTGSSGQASEPRPARFGLAAGVSKPVYDQSSVVVKFKAGATSAAKKHALGRSAGRVSDSITHDVVKVTGSEPATDLLKKLRADPSVELASLNYIRKASATPNDGLYAANQKYLPTVRMPQAWDVTKTAGSQTVAVLDTGIDAGHPELVGRTVPGYNVLAPGTAPVDDNFHGTFVAGVIAANTGNAAGIAGVAWNAKVQPVKVLDQYGEGTDDEVIAGINWATSHGARVINMSLGGPGDNPILHEALANAVAKGIVVVVSAGNSGDDVPQFPAAYPEALAVGATDDNGSLTGFSSYGDWVDIAAPGFDIASTVPRALAPDFPYGLASGTSFSAPIVAGVAALVRNKYPAFTPAQVVAQLKATARDAGPRGIDPYYGAGILDAYGALGGAWTTEFPSAVPDGNDYPAKASPINGNAITGSIDSEGDVDWYKIDSPARNAVVTVTSPEYSSPDYAQNMGPVVSVYDRDVRIIGAAQTPSPKLDDQGHEVIGSLDAATNVNLIDGTTYIAVRSSNGSHDSRPYLLTIGASTTYGNATGDGVWIRDTSVANLSTGVPLDVAPRVTFGRSVPPGVITSDTVRLINGKTGASVATNLSYDTDTQTVTLTPTAPLLDNTPYRIWIGAIQDADSRYFTGYSSWFRTVDNAPQPIGSFTSTGAYLGATLTWKVPPTTDLDQVIVRRNVGNTAPSLSTGTLVYAGTGAAVKTTGLANATTYTFAAWVRDRSGKLSPGAVARLTGTRTAAGLTSTSVTYGAAVTLKGTMLKIDNRPVPGTPVALYWRPKNVATFKLLSTLKTTSTGAVSFTYKPSVSSVLAIAYLGSTELMGSRSANLLVEVKPTISAAISPTTIALGATTKFYGAVRPAHAGMPVYLQQYVNRTWKTLANVKLSTTGSYAFGIRPTSRGTYAYRTVFTADADHAQAISVAKAVTVR
ncbi:S8 family serine peptidase [Kribbella sp. CA-245084]|uniref:S8 family serine peptidase n=1 Tax=Kribbella sp. CA-245084 TaxID=3239940 RepID=UPI003D900EE5